MDDRGTPLTCACGHSFQPPADLAGKEAACPQCGKPVLPPLRVAKSKETPSLSTPRKSSFAPAELPPPALVPGYVIQKRLGSGGMGDVYLARQESLDRQVAIKLLPPELGKDKAYVETFLREARSAAKVSHENIVGAVDVGEASGRYFFVMEHVEGDTLFKIVRTKGILSEARALDVVRQVALGLRHAHKNGLIHRDIKPQNIMITPEGKAKILDFGLARDLSREKPGQSEFVHSTPAYASPEQCRGEPNLDHRADIYALGITLFETMTGKRPFQADTVRRLMTKQVQETPPEPRSLRQEISQEANQLVLRMLRKQPSERFQTYDELIGAIDRIAGSKAVSPPAGAAPPKIPLRWIVAASASVVGIVLVLILAFAGGSKPEDPAAAEAAARAAEADAAAERALVDARGLQRRAEGRPAEYAAVRARWKDLEAKFRGTPHHPQFTAALAEFETKIVSEADAIARSILVEADGHLKASRFSQATAALLKFPDSLAQTEANTKVAAKALEVERALDAHFRQGLSECQALLAAAKFDEARGRLHSLRVALSAENAKGEEEVRTAYRAPLDDLRGKIDAEQVAAAKKAAELPSKPVETPAPPVVAETPAPAVAQTPKTPAAGPKIPAMTVAQFAVLHDPVQRLVPEKRLSAAAFFMAGSDKSPLFRATALFLARDEGFWKLDGAPAKVLDEHLAAYVVPEAVKATPEQHAAALAAMAEKVGGLGSAALEPFHLFAAAHIDAIVEGKGKVDPAVAMALKLGKGPVSDLWGPPASVARIEMAGLLIAGPSLWLARASELAAAGPDFAAKFLGALCLVKDEGFDLAGAAARWKKLAGEAPDPAWAKVCEAVSDRFRQAASCESCLGQGRYPCAYCSAQGVAACAPCRGTGSISDPMDGGKVTCTTCKGRRGAVCAACNGSKGLKCAACDGKKNRASLPGGFSRPIADLALCDACDGAGSLFANAAYPCFTCSGNGRQLDAVPREFLKLPAWMKVREGRGLFAALRWLARHQAKSGAWSAGAWEKACRGPGCKTAPAGDFDLGVTSLALLAFLNAGVGPESELELGGVPAGAVVRGAIAWLLSCQKPDGHLAHGASIKPVFEHLVATYALYGAAQQITPGAAFGEKDRAALREAALRALKWALGQQAKGAGWGYTTQSNSDTWVTSWGGLALLAAREAGIEVPRLNLGFIVQWYDGVTDRKDFHVGYSPTQMGVVNLTGFETFEHHPTLSAFAGLVRYLIENKVVATTAAADRMVMADLPTPAAAERDYCYWHIGTLFLLQREQRKGTAWTTWSNAVVRETLALQEGADTCALGSWPVDERWASMGGRVYATALNALTLGSVAGTRPPAGKAK